MDVSVNESGHQGCPAQVDHRGASRVCHGCASLNDSTAVNQYLAGADQHAMLYVEHMRGMEYDDVAGGRSGCLSKERGGGGDSQSKANGPASGVN